ncbi:hypothetical protein F4679DRAFT_17448 [Xylaria curta]|nr:hypothetical protein F4679DRAFT_17448 [Xylaria curta]
MKYARRGKFDHMIFIFSGGLDSFSFSTCVLMPSFLSPLRRSEQNPSPGRIYHFLVLASMRVGFSYYLCPTIYQHICREIETSLAPQIMFYCFWQDDRSYKSAMGAS